MYLDIPSKPISAMNKGSKQGREGITTRSGAVGQCPKCLRHQLRSYRPTKTTWHTRPTQRSLLIRLPFQDLERQSFCLIYKNKCRKLNKMKRWKNNSQMKEQEKSPGRGKKKPKEMELSNLHYKEAKESQKDAHHT